MAVIFSAALVVPVVAADPPVIPAELPSATKPDAKRKAAAKKTAAKPAASETKSKGVIVLVSPEPAVVSQKHVNVRGQAVLNSEVVAQLKKGDKIMVLEEITTKKKKDEPDKWYKIALPPAASVWVNSAIGLDADKKVKASRLNLRSGPGENYSVIGRVEKGTALTVVESKGDWSKIEPPAGSFAYVAAHLVSLEPAGSVVVAANTQPAPPVIIAPPPVITVPAPPVVVQAQPNEPVTPPVVAPPVLTPPILVPVVRPTPPPLPEEQLVKRVVTREGIVKNSVSVQAPTHFVLRDLDNNRTINYLFSPATNILIKDFKGQRVIVTGEESLDERWPNTPVIEIDTLRKVDSQ